MVKNFIEDFYKFKTKILNKENFAYTRYADGEVKLMNGIGVGFNTQAYQADKWSCDNKMYRLGKDLLLTLNHEESNYYYAISSPNQSLFDFEFLMSHIKQPFKNITFSDLWINGNYSKFKEFMFELKEPIVLIASHDGEHRLKDPLLVQKYYAISDDCVNHYEVNHEKIKQDMKQMATQYYNTLFFISAGPLSEILIHELYTNNPNNRYIDVGSAIDEIVHGKKTRPYMVENSIYSKEIVSWTI